MFIDHLPILSFARLLRTDARNVALRNDTRAVGMVGLANGEHMGPDTIVRFDIAAGEDPGRLLDGAFATTRARAFWFYGGDTVARRASADLTLTLVPSGAAYARRMDAEPRALDVRLRPPGVRDRMTVSEARAEFAPGFIAPDILFATLSDEIVGMALCEPLDSQWTEVRLVVYPAHRGRGLGTAIFGVLADRLERSGRLVCASIDGPHGRGRGALERSGFRLTDYYFTARRAAR